MTALETKLLKALKEILAEATRPTDPALKCGVIKWTAIEAIEAIEEADDNSRLICAAPELLEVMEDILKYQVRNDWMDLPFWVRAKNAVAKAKGGE
jgi:hypothetical protein